MDKKVVYCKLGLILLVLGQISETYCQARLEMSQADRRFRFKSCSHNFPAVVHSCMDPFLSRMAVLFKAQTKTSKFFYNIFQDYYCLKYESMLMCLHQALSACPSPGTLQLVQAQLSLPWVPVVNLACGINVANSLRELKHSRQGNVLPGDTGGAAGESETMGEIQQEQSNTESTRQNDFGHKHLKQTRTEEEQKSVEKNTSTKAESNSDSFTDHSLINRLYSENHHETKQAVKPLLQQQFQQSALKVNDKSIHDEYKILEKEWIVTKLGNDGQSVSALDSKDTADSNMAEFTKLVLWIHEVQTSKNSNLQIKPIRLQQQANNV